MRRAAIAAATALAACALAPAVAGAGAGPTRTVTIHDDYFSPSKLTVKAGTTIRWVWPTGLTDTHDVMLDRHPKGVKPFMSDYAAGDYVFKRTLTKPGTYTFICDLHQGMKLTVAVKPR
jgi:plastocyanin